MKIQMVAIRKRLLFFSLQPISDYSQLRLVVLSTTTIFFAFLLKSDHPKSGGTPEGRVRTSSSGIELLAALFVGYR